ncbi:hypothetical protein Cni_G07316 [Canna indica]|uniref:Uncharacterized protein n=1 Tax=Canna indica TaxID=4628 RepID=A0AAQ3Q7E9_9LILI|nr:hypothetical protein Cni_G07316 [Canna indica]
MMPEECSSEFVRAKCTFGVNGENYMSDFFMGDWPHEPVVIVSRNLFLYAMKVSIDITQAYGVKKKRFPPHDSVDGQPKRHSPTDAASVGHPHGKRRYKLWALDSILLLAL